ncbi:MAG TPA: hypothetical protein VL357_06970 [Rariglobus sp.]|nr:hypothetical protein [Rariglobus sp.]
MLLVCLAPAGVFSSKAVTLDDLVQKSPFLPGGQESVQVAPTENATVEFRGMIATKEGVLFGLYDRTKQIGAWVKKDDKSADFVVQSYDPANDMVAVDYHGQKFNLTLSSVKIGTAAPSVPMPMPVAGPVGSQPAPAVARVDDQRRLESIATEVRRRRALRLGAANGAVPQATTQPEGGKR